MGAGSLLWPLIRFVLGFALVLVLAALASRAVARRATGGRMSPFRLLGGLALGPGRQLCAVQVGRRVLILGLGDKQVRLLYTIEDRDEVDEFSTRTDTGTGVTGSLGRGFAAAVARARAQAGGRALDR